MPLTGIEIFKLLPKTNCGECGVPTCLAFAMNLAAGKAELTKCPKLSEESIEDQTTGSISSTYQAGNYRHRKPGF